MISILFNVLQTLFAGMVKFARYVSHEPAEMVGILSNTIIGCSRNLFPVFGFSITYVIRHLSQVESRIYNHEWEICEN